jgi:tricorn protease
MSRLPLLPCLLLALLPASLQAEPVRFAQTPALSPDGATLAFGWRGDIWTVPVKGGSARRLTQHPAMDSTPVFSPDGAQIAFLSERDGGRQVHLMPVRGGPPAQITFHSEGYDLAAWMPDGKELLVTVVRDHSWTRGSRSARMALLDVKVRKAEHVLLDDYAAECAVSPDGQKVLFVREGESWWRQGYRGARSGQIWMLNRADGACTQVKAEQTECRFPLWKADSSGFYFTSNRGGDGAFNLWEHDFASAKSRQITEFKSDSVVFPTLSKDGGTLVFRHLADLYRWHPGQGKGPEKIRIQHNGDIPDAPVQRRVLDRATRVACTANGLQMAFIADGDLWVMDTELREPRQVTRTPEEESDPVFSPDGKALYFVSDSGGQSDIWKAAPALPAKYWWENTEFKLEKITDDPAVESALTFSPDGKRLAWLKERGDLWLADASGKNARRIFTSWNRPRFDFSPDGQWIVYSQSDEWFNSDIWLQPTDGSKPPFNLSRHPNNDEAPVWSPDGRLIAWTGKREGDEVDICYVWLRAQDDEQSRRERTAQKAREKIAKAGAAPKSATSASPPSAKPAPAKPAETEPAKAHAPEKQIAAADGKKEEPKKEEPKPAPKPAPLPMDLADIHERIRRISIPNTSESGLVWSPDSKKLAFAATVDGKRGTYTLEFPDDLKPKLLAAATLSDARWIKEGNQILGLSEGVPAALSSSGSLSSWRFRALQSTDRPGRQRAVFDLCWRVMRDHYYDENLGNRDWDSRPGQIRRRWPPRRLTWRGVQEIVHLMLGELNGSHLGFTLSRHASWQPPPPGGRRPPISACALIPPIPALAGRSGMSCPRAPPAHQSLRRIHPGETVLQRGWHRESTARHTDVSERAQRPPRARRDPPRQSPRRQMAKSATVTLRPISYITARRLLYDDWIAENRSRVEKTLRRHSATCTSAPWTTPASKSSRRSCMHAGAGKDGLIIDVRENGGGSTTDHLLTALTQPRHAIAIPRGSSTPGYPQDRMIYATWQKPIVVLCNQNSYSNAEVFSHAIKTLKRGQLVGVPTAGGVISTGSDVASWT